MVYLIEKGRIAAESFSRLTRMLETATGQFKEIPVDLALARALMHVNVQQIPDMPDRLIAASAFLHQVPVISRDRKIVSSKLVTIW